MSVNLQAIALVDAAKSAALHEYIASVEAELTKTQQRLKAAEHAVEVKDQKIDELEKQLAPEPEPEPAKPKRGRRPTKA